MRLTHLTGWEPTPTGVRLILTQTGNGPVLHAIGPAERLRPGRHLRLPLPGGGTAWVGVGRRRGDTADGHTRHRVRLPRRMPGWVRRLLPAEARANPGGRLPDGRHGHRNLTGMERQARGRLPVLVTAAALALGGTIAGGWLDLTAPGPGWGHLLSFGSLGLVTGGIVLGAGMKVLDRRDLREARAKAERACANDGSEANDGT